MKDFFISYNKADCQWAEWIAWLLEEAGFSTIIQAWDFRPGSNFVLDMQRATAEANRTIAVLSEGYLNSLFTQPEWTAAFVHDPTSNQAKLLPVRVRQCELKGLLASIVYIDLIGVGEERAKETLLAGVNQGRAKPTLPPSFPGTNHAQPLVNEKPLFPGAHLQADTSISDFKDNRRRIDAAVPATAKVGDQIDLLVQVRFPDSPLLGIEDWPYKRRPERLEQQSAETTGLEFPVNPTTGVVEAATLFIRVVTNDFDIIGEVEKRLEVSPDDLSKKLPFLLVARKSGNCRINVEVYSSKQAYIGIIPVETEVDGQPMRQMMSVAHLAMTVTAFASPMAANPFIEQLTQDGARNVAIGGHVSGPTVITGDQNTILIQQAPRDTDRSNATSLARDWLTALYRLREEKQISPEDHMSVLEHMLPGEIDSTIDRQSVEALLARHRDFAGRVYREFSDVKQISKRVVTRDVARAHQILTAIQLKLNVVLVDQGVRFALIPPGTTRNGIVNRSCFYLAETVLTESDWARIMNLPGENSSQPWHNLSLNDVRTLLDCANKGSRRWVIPSSDQWLFAVEATESVAPRQRSLTLKAAPPSSFGVYDLLGVIWQFTRSHKSVEVQGGSHLTTISSIHKIPAPEPVCMDELESDDWGFRPALLLL